MSNDPSKLKDKTVLLGVSAGIAAYKAVDLASKLTAAGADVFTIMTENATELIGPKSFEAITANPVFIDMWQQEKAYEIGHISLTERADIFVVAPASADIIAKAANGICDDMLSTSLCAAWNTNVLLCPAMNNNMWTNPAVQKNIETLKQNGFKMIGPETGRLACGSEGVGRMSKPIDILKQIEKVLD